MKTCVSGVSAPTSNQPELFILIDMERNKGVSFRPAPDQAGISEHRSHNCFIYDFFVFLAQGWDKAPLGSCTLWSPRHLCAVKKQTSHQALLRDILRSY